MKNPKIIYSILLILAIVGLSLRLYRLPELTTFEWDQARDLGVMNEILKGNFTLIGPAVRGEGSFFLGPLYYYLGAALLALSSGNPLSLAVFAVVLDVLVGLLVVKLCLRASPLHAIFAGAVWMSSSYLINLSHIPWNVSLLSLWLILMILLWQRFPHASLLEKAAYFTLASFSTHIHLSIVGLAAVFLLSRSREFFRQTPRVKLILLFFLLLPLTPLLLFDLRHDFLNTWLFLRFLKGSTGHTGLTDFAPVLLAKLDYTLSEFLLSARWPLVGLIAFLTACFSAFRRREPLDWLLLALLVAVPAMLLIYRDLDFAEYYLVPTFIPLLLLLSRQFSSRLPDRRLLLIATALVTASNLTGFSASPHSFSLATKSSLAKYLAGHASVLELRLEAPPGRRDGINYLLSREGVKMSRGAPVIAVVTESDKQAVLLSHTDKLGEETFGGLRVTVFKVQ